MNDPNFRVRANKTTGELELEGPVGVVTEWWARLWPELSSEQEARAMSPIGAQRQVPGGTGELPEMFGEFYSEFRSDVTDVTRMLIAGAFVQSRDSDKAFTTKSANQLLMDQNVKLANPSECVRRLIQSKRAFVLSEGRYRVSATGFDYLQSLRNS